LSSVIHSIYVCAMLSKYKHKIINKGNQENSEDDRQEQSHEQLEPHDQKTYNASRYKIIHISTMWELCEIIHLYKY
jgi:hypothetical protein